MNAIVNNENVTSLFDWSQITDDKEGMKMFSLFDRSSQQAKGSMSDWVWRMAMEEQWEKEVKSPLERKQTVADNFSKRLQAACDWVSSEAAGEYRLDLARVKLTGNGGVAGAFKKIHTGILNGLDLKEFRSASACQTENTKISKAGAEADVSKRRREEAMLDAKDAGLEEGTPEFETEVDRLIQEMIRKATEESSSDNSPIPGGSNAAQSDKFDLMGQEVANVLRILHKAKLAEFEGSEERDAEKTAILNVEQQLDKILRNITSICEASQATLAASAGLIEDVAQAS